MIVTEEEFTENLKKISRAIAQGTRFVRLTLICAYKRPYMRSFG